jgi:hypothetical protein
MRTARLLSLASLVALTAFVAAGPPWISVEYPVNPYDAASRGAFILVHAFHHGMPMDFPVSGTAEGLVDGARRTVSLQFKHTSRPGVYALDQQWPGTGLWTLVLNVSQGRDESGTAQAIVELGANGQVASVAVPTTQRGGWTIPAPISTADIEAALRARANRLASR